MVSKLPTRTKILIVGAGPAGLTTAISLVKHGVELKDITVVDGLEAGDNSSRACMLHAGTLEALDLIGCAEKIVKIGNTNKKTGVHFQDRDGNTVVGNDFSALAPYTKYPYFIGISQAIAEVKLLEDATELGITIFRPIKVTDVKQNTSGPGLDVFFDSGEVVNASYVIGADGARSVVRESVGIGFHAPSGAPPEDAPETVVAQMIMADVSFSTPIPSKVAPHLLCLTPNPNGLFLTISLDDESSKSIYKSQNPIYRIGFTVPLSKGAPPQYPDANVIQEYINHQGPFHISSDPEVNPNPIKVTEVHWASRFRIRSASADTFFKKIGDKSSGGGGLVFLVGDAAHIHPPSGGQGMNLGIRDAVGLGSIIAEHMRVSNGDLDVGVDKLEAFAMSRREGALKVIKLTKILVMSAAGVMTSKFIAYGLKFASMMPFFNSTLVWNLSGLGDPILAKK